MAVNPSAKGNKGKSNWNDPEYIKQQKASLEGILESLITTDKNLNLKTNIKNIEAFTQLHVAKQTYYQFGWDLGYLAIKWFMDFYKEIAPSERGKRASDILKAFNSWQMKIEGLKDLQGMDKLFTTLRE